MNRTFKLLPLAVLITTAWAAQAQQVAYSPEMIRALVPAGQDVDMSFIEKGYNLPPASIASNSESTGTISPTPTTRFATMTAPLSRFCA